MAQTGFTPIQLYSSSTATNVPLAANLATGELAINITDGKLFYKDNTAAVQVIGWKVVPATAGGTGQTSYAVGDLLYADTTTTLAKLPDVATGNALISGGVGVAPSYGKIGLTTHVSGTLGVGNGGTGTATAFTAGSVVFAGASGVYSQDNANLFWDDSNNRLGVGTATPGVAFDVYGTGSVLGQFKRNNTGGASGGVTIGNNSGTFTLFVDTTFVIYDNQNSASRVSIDASGNTTIGQGNLVIGTSGKGIDFSATAGTGTSELLADYEEGTWTPNQGAGLTVVGAFSSSGIYTKTGRQVTVTARLSGATSIAVTSLGVLLTNLPFAALGSIYLGQVTDNNAAVATGCGVLTTASTNTLNALESRSATTNIFAQITYFV